MSNPLTTTIETSARWLDGINLRNLSPTLRDAIILTRALAYRYISGSTHCACCRTLPVIGKLNQQRWVFYSQSCLTIGARPFLNGLFGQIPRGEAWSWVLPTKSSKWTRGVFKSLLYRPWWKALGQPRCFLAVHSRMDIARRGPFRHVFWASSFVRQA
jgi:hypothetical protein